MSLNFAGYLISIYHLNSATVVHGAVQWLEIGSTQKGFGMTMQEWRMRRKFTQVKLLSCIVCAGSFLDCFHFSRLRKAIAGEIMGNS